MARGRTAGNRGQGHHWISDKRRAAIYARDKHACVWCNDGNPPLTLDHVVPRSRGGTNKSSNLITACMHCNRVRGDHRVPVYACWLAHGDLVLAAKIVRAVRNAQRRKLPKPSAQFSLMLDGKPIAEVSNVTIDGVHYG